VNAPGSTAGGVPGYTTLTATVPTPGGATAVRVVGFCTSMPPAGALPKKTCVARVKFPPWIVTGCPPRLIPEPGVIPAIDAAGVAVAATREKFPSPVAR